MIWYNKPLQKSLIGIHIHYTCIHTFESDSKVSISGAKTVRQTGYRKIYNTGIQTNTKQLRTK